MRASGIIGWDIGGAHVKLARLSTGGRLLAVEQHPCPLWKGLAQLDTLLIQLHARLDLSQYRHAVTMTGELVDIFPDRRHGVRSLLRSFLRHAQTAHVGVYTRARGLRSVDYARRHTPQVASANWHATAALVARQCSEALVIDVGSTTTDLIPIHRGRINARGGTDGERMRHGELIYTGVVRTPLMAVVRQLPFAGEWQCVAAEWFATTGDVYVLTGSLPRRHYQASTADGAGLGAADCARRLARMLGRDVEEATMTQWRELARHIAGEHQRQVFISARRVLSRLPATGARHVIGAGCGQFIARAVARQLGYPYLDISEFLRAPPRLKEMATVCTPAVAVARLAL